MNDWHKGQRVKLTDMGIKMNVISKKTTYFGVVNGDRKPWNKFISVLPDGYKSVRSFHPDFWEPVI